MQSSAPITYSIVASSRGLLHQPPIVLWLNRVVGSIFASFALALRRKRVAA